LLDRKARYEVVLGRYDDASRTYREVLSVDPKYRDANYNLAQLALRRLELFEARQLLDQELAFYPDNYSALCQLGELSLQRDDYDAAFGFFTRAFEVEKQELRAQIGLARSARLLKRLSIARKFVEGILAVNSNDLDANLEMGRILRDEENYEEASKYYTIVLDLLDSAGDALPEQYIRIKADALIARGEVRLLTTGPSTANADFSAALKTLPDYPAAYLQHRSRLQGEVRILEADRGPQGGRDEPAPRAGTPAQESGLRARARGFSTTRCSRRWTRTTRASTSRRPP
jgi:tetratricopeptide (TPR) repeat protein